MQLISFCTAIQPATQTGNEEKITMYDERCNGRRYRTSYTRTRTNKQFKSRLIRKQLISEQELQIKANAEITAKCPEETKSFECLINRKNYKQFPFFL